MKKSIFWALLFALCSVFTSCNDGVEEALNAHTMATSTSGEWRLKTNEINDGNWKVVVVEIVNGVEKDSAIYNGKLSSSLEIYEMTTTYTTEPTLKSVSFTKSGDVVRGGYENGIRTATQNYVHNLDKVNNLQVVHSWQEGTVTLKGITVTSPNRNAAVSYYGEPAIVEDGKDDEFAYHMAKMSYTVSIDGKSSTADGFHRLAVAAEIPEDELVNIRVTDSGFEELTYDTNGNLKTGKSWLEIVRVYSVSGESAPVKEEVVLNFFVNGVARTIEYGSSFAGIVEAGTGAEAVVDGASRKVGSHITATSHTQSYNSGLVFDGKTYSKVFNTGWETAVWSEGDYTFNMPSPAFEGVKTNWGSPVNLTTSNGYERKLQTITLNGSINAKALKGVKAETELRVKEEEETFTYEIIDSAFTYINPTTSNTRITIRKTGSKGSKSEYKRDVNVYNGIEAPASVTKDVKTFDVRSIQAKLNPNDEYVGKRESGEFTIYKYKMSYTVGSESVDRTFALYYERAFHNPTKHWMMWKKYTNLTDNGFSTSDLAENTRSGETYLRKKYVYSISATYNGHGENASAEAILRVKVNNNPDRQTPAWLGAPQWADYTRVQKGTGEKFEDMVVFGYENGVVLAPAGKADLTNGIFAYDQAVATANGVQKCAKGSCYTAVYKSGSWIPAKCETYNNGKSNETWIYTGKGVSHSVMADNAISLGIGKDVTWNPKEEVAIEDGTITVKYSKNNASLNGKDITTLR